MNGDQKNIVVGTAGHVDHGKTALVRALTGIDTDRLKEEKERGMTIEPGFAYWRLPSGQTVSVVDVPGHERFIKNMLRGISGIDIAILVVAADDGVMPQTREHLDILRLLNIQYGLVVISKVDLVDEEIFLMATEEVRNLIQGTFLEDTPLISFSAKTGQGIEEINRAIEDISQQVVEKDRDGVFRLPIDRVFTMAGYGTIVTGTIASGKVRRGDVIEIYPLGKTTNARNIQIHNQWVNEAYAGHRVGLNLPNVKVEDIERGMVAGGPHSLISTHLINATFQYLKSNKYPLHNRMKVKFYSGTSEVIGRMILMDKDILHPRETCFVQFRLENKLSPLPYDRYIIRTLSPMNTIGGGVILEINPKKYRSIQPEPIDHLKVLERRINHETVEAFIKKERFRPVRLPELAKRLCLSQHEIETACDHLSKENRILFIEDDSVIHKESYDQLKTEILERINNFHERKPNLKDASQEEIWSKISPQLNRRLYEAVLREVYNEGKIKIKKGRIKIAGFQAKLDAKQKLVYDQLDGVCKWYRFRPLPLNVLKRIQDRYGEKEVEAVLKLMIGEGRLVKLRNHRVIHSEAIEEIKRILKERIEKKGQVALGEAMEVLGVGRTQTQPIFDYLDSIRFTMRIGDYRVLHKSVERGDQYGEEYENKFNQTLGTINTVHG
ncbi:MAG: selenocysteine-specific translation elongation factor [Deltaproteobacteria bacterium CG_4_8_14_3_um_filter_45_9]|nr:MAG: selenocysteine-specific translation elongation factor [Deltaproteobacteria bacterium CG03_land_8_20_14_0_80_45_14]PIX24086.1 MAG: selenocysteine-specific translation elongation factor [Deltaproteobacteria bacterium CG_4_8_14_3_um_filter_45_9]